MASAFWGGFADTMKGDMDKNDAAKRELQNYAGKKEIDMDYETTDVEDVNQAGKPVIRKINGKGKVVSERLLTQTEQEARMDKKRETVARLTSAEAAAEVAGKEASHYDEDRTFAQDDKKMGRRIQQGQLDYQYASLDALKADRADKSADRKLGLQDRAEARGEKTNANSAETFAAKQIHELTLRLSQQPNDGAGVGNKQRILKNTQERINKVLQSDKPVEVKKRIIQNLIDTPMVYLPQYSATKPEVAETP